MKKHDSDSDKPQFQALRLEHLLHNTIPTVKHGTVATWCWGCFWGFWEERWMQQNTEIPLVKKQQQQQNTKLVQITPDWAEGLPSNMTILLKHTPKTICKWPLVAWPRLKPNQTSRQRPENSCPSNLTELERICREERHESPNPKKDLRLQLTYR